MTGDELRSMIAEIEAKHGPDVDFYAARVWAMRNRFILVRILDNEMRWPEKPKMTKEKRREAAISRRQQIYDMAKTKIPHKKIGEAFGVSSGRVGEILRQYNLHLRIKAMKEASE